MSSSTFRIGITRDTLREDGTAIFDARALQLFADPQCDVAVAKGEAPFRPPLAA